MSELRKEVTIEKKFYDIIIKRISNTTNDFNSVDEYLDFILNEVMTDDDEEEKKVIEEELKKLGYI
jgi:hypothetical protein